MIYKKIKFAYKYCEKNRFYRVLLVKNDISLEKLGNIMASSLRVAFEHAFTFDMKEQQFVPYEWMDDDIFGTYLPYTEFNINALPNNFTFTYDTGENYEFACKISTKEVEKDDDRNVIVLEASGMGIFENDRDDLDNYLAGYIPGDTKEDDEEKHIYMPYNLVMDKYSDFDEVIDLEDLQDELDIYNEEKDNGEELFYSIKDYYNEDEENEDDTFSMNDSPDKIKKVVINAVKEQILNLAYVRDTFNRLSSRYGEDEAYEYIATALLTEIFEAEKNNESFDEDRYIKRLNKLG